MSLLYKASEIVGLPINDQWRLHAAKTGLPVYKKLGSLSESREILTPNDKKRFDRGKEVDCSSISLVSRWQLKRSFTSMDDSFCISAVISPRRIQSELDGDAFKLQGHTSAGTVCIPLVQDLTAQELKEIMTDMDSFSAITGAQRPFSDILTKLSEKAKPFQDGIEKLRSFMAGKVEITHIGASIPFSPGKLDRN